MFQGRSIRWGLGLAIAGLLLTACAPGANESLRIANGQGQVAGFWLGLWHGIIAPVTFIVSLFKDGVGVYEAHNSGGWYNFGFLLGACCSLGGGSHGASRRGGPAKRTAGKGAQVDAMAHAFLAGKRLALVGVSRQSEDFSRGLFRELVRRGYDMVPVNPAMADQQVEGRRCYARPQDIQPAVDGAILMTPPAESEGAVRDCVQAGIRRVWLHRGVGPGSVSEAALKLCQDHGLEVVAGECPYMFLPDSGSVHRLHRLLRRPGAAGPTAAPAP